MSLAIPTVMPFGIVNANDIIIFQFQSNDLNSFVSFSTIITNINDGTKKTSNQPIIHYDNSISDYIQQNSITDIIMVVCENYYNLVLPKNYCLNGNRYSSEVSFYDSLNNLYSAPIYIFQCYSDPIIQLENYVYQDNIVHNASGLNLLTIEKSLCKMFFSYSQNEGDNLKYYQFYLYDNNFNLLGKTSKIYSSDIVYSIENYNNLHTYILKLQCVSQNNVAKELYITLNINYKQDNIYADITFLLDKQTATNNVYIDIIQLNGTGENFTYDNDINGENVIIAEDGYVNFIDQYQTITQNFLCRIWCSNLKEDMPILKIQSSDNSCYVDVFFTGSKFIAYKYSCGLKTIYSSNELVIPSKGLTDIPLYFSIGYYDGRIEMFSCLQE